jgi:hypothetical protein
MNSDEDENYMKIVSFVGTYNFVFQTFFIWNHLDAQMIDIIFSFSSQHIF